MDHVRDAITIAQLVGQVLVFWAVWSFSTGRWAQARESKEADTVVRLNVLERDFAALEDSHHKLRNWLDRGLQDKNDERYVLVRVFTEVMSGLRQRLDHLEGQSNYADRIR